MSLRKFLFEACMTCGFFETTVFLEGEGATAKDALINLAANLYEAQHADEEQALRTERRRAEQMNMPDTDEALSRWLLGDFTIEPGAADGGVIFSMCGFIELPAPVAVAATV